MFYASMASAGYFSTYNYTNSVVIVREPLTNMDPDYFMLVAAGCLCFVLFAAFPLNYNPFRNQFFILIIKKTSFSQKE
jgi:hypothetical protein